MRAAKIVGGVVATYIEVGEFTADWVDPTGSQIGDLWDGEKFTTPAVHIDLAGLKLELAAAVDDHIAEILKRWLRFEAGYVKREAAARAYVAAGYEGEPGIWLTSFAGPAGLTYAQAADRVIMQADALNLALEQLEATRMAKYGIYSAATPDVAQGEYQKIINQADIIEKGLA